MIPSAFAQSVSFYSAIAPLYDELMNRQPGDVWIRSAFQNWVAQSVEPASLILDFGCGTGIDARWYARRGYRVVAYDPAPAMQRQARRACASEIAQGRVQTLSIDYETFLATLEQQPRPQAVVANFAVFNLLPNLRPLFARLASHLAPPAWVIVSLLNPWFWKEQLPRLRRAKSRIHSLPHIEGRRIISPPLYRYLPTEIIQAASPSFVLTKQAGLGAFIHYGRGHYVWGQPRSLAEWLEYRCCELFPLTRLGKYLFLTLRRAT
jgi:SAM-dependent methyltransferase